MPLDTNHPVVKEIRKRRAGENLPRNLVCQHSTLGRHFEGKHLECTTRSSIENDEKIDL